MELFNFSDPSKNSYYLPFILIIFLIYLLLKTVINIFNKQNNDTYNSEIQMLNDIDSSILKSRINSLRCRYLIAYITTRIAFWAKDPYLYFLFMTVHKFSFAEIGILFLIPIILVLILSITLGPLRSQYKIGRRFYFHICNISNIIGILLIIQCSRLLAYLGQIIIGIVGYNSIFEQWLNNEIKKEFGEYKNEAEHFKKKLFITQAKYDSIIVIITCIIVAIIFSYYGIKAPFWIYIFFAAISSIIVAFLWDENINDNNNDTSTLGIFLSALKELKKIDVLCIGLIEGILKAVLNIFLFMWTPILVESSSDKINIGFIYTIIFFTMILGAILIKPLIMSKKSDKYMSLAFCIFLQGLFLLLAYFLDSFFWRIIFLSLFNGLNGFYNPLNEIIKSDILVDKYKALLNVLFYAPSIAYTIIVYLTLTFMTPFTLALIGGIMSFIAFIIGIILVIVLCFYQERNHNNDNYLGVNIE